MSTRNGIRSAFLLSVALYVAACISPTSLRADVYEMRTYTANEGKLEALHSRFRDHTLKLFEKHGIENVGYWVPTNEEQSKNTLIYIIKHADRDAAKKSWAAFMSDEDWKKAYQDSIADGRLVAKVESVYMNATDYSPEPKADNEKHSKDSEAVFELRIYNTNAGKLDGLNARFRDHTLKLFEKHSIQNVAYWTPADEPASENQLIYVIKHASPDAAKASWSAFGADDEWKKVAKESQKDGAFLSERPTSIFMKATDYSPMQ